MDLGVIPMKKYSTFLCSKIRASLSDCLLSYTGHSLEGVLHSEEMQSVYSTDPDDWAGTNLWIIVTTLVRY